MPPPKQKAAPRCQTRKRRKRAIVQQTRRTKELGQSSNQVMSEEEKITFEEGDAILKRKKICLDTDSGANEPKAKQVQSIPKSVVVEKAEDIQSTPNDVVKEAKVDACQELFDIIMKLKTSKGRLLCKSFIRAPSRTRFPDYYDIIATPIDLLEIEQNLETKAYADIEEFTSDVELIFNNAKSYYKESSQEHLDACILWKMFSFAKNTMHKTEYIQKKEERCNEIDDNSMPSSITGYDLYASETRNSYIAANPDIPHELINYFLKNEGRQVPIPRQAGYEMRAYHQNETLHVKRLRESKTQFGVDKKNTLFCLWNNCHQQFDNAEDLLSHLTSVPDGHIQQSSTKEGLGKFERKCLWFNCQLTKKYRQQFSAVSYLISHVKKVHLRLSSTDDITLLRRNNELLPVDPIEQPSPTDPTSDYEFEGGKRLVDMGYFIKSLQGLNDHKGKKCNFFNMKVYGETNHGDIDGILFKCNKCPTTKVIWLEDPGTEELPQYLSIRKTKSQNHIRQEMLPVISSAPQKKTSTPPLVQTKPQLLKDNKTLRNPPPQTQYIEILQVQSVTDQQVPPTVESQQSINVQTKVPNDDQSQDHAIDQTQVLLSDFPPVASIKQEIILPDDGTIPSFINSSSELTRVDTNFYVDGDENATDSLSAPYDGTMAIDVTESITTTPSVSVHDRTHLQWPSGQISSSNVTVNHDSSITDVLPVDLNVVKTEPVDRTESITTTPSVSVHDHTSLQWPSGQISSSNVIVIRDSSIMDAIPVNLNLVKKEPVDLDLLKEEVDDIT